MSLDDDDFLTEDEPHYTKLLTALAGSFDLSRASIPYFVSTLALQEVVDGIRLAEEIPDDYREKWRLEELFQREIDWARVRESIVDGYLKRPEKLLFFNAITVALLPLDDVGQISKSYGEAEKSPGMPPGLKPEAWALHDIGNVQVARAKNRPETKIRWHSKRVFPAAIDGQHRVAALQELVRAGGLTSRQLNTTVSVLFLVLDERVGFKCVEAGQESGGILSVIREIFIDLNKSAREVPFARQILLDDLEIESRCVRQLIAERMNLDNDSERLPLGAVWWSGDRVGAKFNTGKNTAPFLTTVPLLHLIVQDLLDLKRPKDPFDTDQRKKFALSIDGQLQVSRMIEESPDHFPGLMPLIKLVEKEYENQDRPFANLPARYLRVCDSAFNDKWRKLIVTLFREFEPYKKFLSEVRSRGGIDGEEPVLASYMVMHDKARKRLSTLLAEQFYPKVVAHQEALHEMKKTNWAFYAVFQRALFRVTFFLRRQYDLFSKDTGHDAFVKEILAFWNSLYATGYLEVRAQLSGEKLPYWVGISVTKNGTIQWSDSSRNRMYHFLLLVYYYRRLSNVEFGTFLKRINDSEKFPEGAKAKADILKQLKSVVSREDEELEDEQLEVRAHGRLRSMLEVLK